MRIIFPLPNCPSFVTTLFASLLVLLWTGASHAGLSDAVKMQKLGNGMTVLVLENHKAPVATFNIFFKVGSRNEQFGKTGLSHLVEHMMFRGTKKLKPEEFSNIIQQNGGMDNAFTTADFTDYFEVINRDHLDVPISLEADRMANFAPKGFDSEKAVVMEERRMRTDDNPEDALSELTQAQAYLAHPYHWPVIGWMHDIQGLTLDDVLAYHNVYYKPQNAIAVAVGDFDADKVLKQISEDFDGVKNGPKPPLVTEVEPPQEGPRQLMMRHAADVPAFAEAFHVPNFKNTSDAFALEIASEILSDGKSSRLYKSVVIDRRMAVDIDASYDMTSFDPGLFWISAQLRPGVKTDDVLAEIDRQLAALRDKPVGEQELRKAKNLEQADFVFSQDSIFREAMLLGLYQMLGDYRMVDQYLPNIEKVTPADIQRVAKQYLVENNRTLGILIPTGVLPPGAGGGGPSGGAIHHVQDDEAMR
ncbi:MAG TPA: pitrilysin family protein [Candidatus Binataceae bacterium]|nr:pitrilysin family protein [Candidatus Binataceae bacterium]